MKKNENAQIMLNFQSEVAVIPASAIAFVDKAKKFDIKVLLLIASSEKYRKGNYITELALALECDESAATASVSFWNGTGVIFVGGVQALHQHLSSGGEKQSVEMLGQGGLATAVVTEDGNKRAFLNGQIHATQDHLRVLVFVSIVKVNVNSTEHIHTMTPFR